MRDTKKIGNITEAMVLAALLRKNYGAVMVPWGDNERYDLVVEKNGEFYRVQCKTGKLKNGAVYVDAPGYKGQIEFLAVYCPQTGACYLVPSDRFKTSIHLRVLPAKNGQAKKVLWAKEFEV